MPPTPSSIYGHQRRACRALAGILFSESQRLLQVIERRWEDQDYLAGDYSIADKRVAVDVRKPVVPF